MPHLLNFANEILYQIIAATNPHDIESLAASCRTINSLAEFKLKRHHELKRKYASLSFRAYEDSHCFPAVHPIYLLQDVLHDETIAQYPTIIRSTPLIDDRYEWLNDDLDIGELKGVREVAVRCKNEIVNAIYQCCFIQVPEREAWIVQIMQGNGEAIFGLLLTLLPHLTSIEMVQRPEGLFMKMFKRIVELQQSPHMQALTKLTRIDTTPYCSEEDMDVLSANEFNYLSQYMLLPSMRTITGSHFKIDINGDDQTFQWRHNPGISDVREINIDRSTVDGESITNLLRGVRALERFSFTFGVDVPTRPVHQSRKIINGLGHYAKCSLSYLHLTSIRVGMITMQGDDLEYNLRCFEKLKQLHIDHTLLSHHDRPCLAPASGILAHKLKYRSRMLPDQGCNCWPQRLVDVLPASLESLKLVGSVPWKRVRAFFAGFPELKAERVPRLREIEMQGSAAAELRFVHLCKKVGVVLSQNGDKDDVYYQCASSSGSRFEWGKEEKRR